MEEEVRRQVQQALSVQQRNVSELQEENKRLREQLRCSTHPVPERDRAPTSSHPVPERDRAYTSSHPVPERDRAYTGSHPVPERDRAYTSSHPVPERDRAYTGSHPVPERDRAYNSGQAVPERDRAYNSSQAVPERDRAYNSSQAVPERDRAYNSSQAVPERDRAYNSSQAVPERDRAYSSSQAVPEREVLSEGNGDVSRGGSLPTFVPYQEGEVGRGDYPRSGFSPSITERAPRVASQDRRTTHASRSPTRVASQSPRLRAGSVSASARGRYLRGGVGELLQSLSDGDIGSVQPTEAAYRPTQTHLGVTFGDYDLSRPPGLELSDQSVRRERARLEPPSAHDPLSQAEPEQAGRREQSAPNPLDVLITGMSQFAASVAEAEGRDA